MLCVILSNKSFRSSALCSLLITAFRGRNQRFIMECTLLWTIAGYRPQCEVSSIVSWNNDCQVLGCPHADNCALHDTAKALFDIVRIKPIIGVFPDIHWARCRHRFWIPSKNGWRRKSRGTNQWRSGTYSNNGGGALLPPLFLSGWSWSAVLPFPP